MNNNFMEDFEFILQYQGQEPLILNTYLIEEDVLRMRLGLNPRPQDQ